MAKNKLPDFPVLEISAFLDAATVTIVGHRVDFLMEGDELYVLGVGMLMVPKTDAPLVVPKATIEVVAQAGDYAVAKTPPRETLVPIGVAAMVRQLSEGLETQYRSQPLSRDETQFLGNPGHSRVSTGDLVIRKKDLVAYVDWKKSLEISTTGA